MKLSFRNQSTQRLPLPERQGFIWASIGHRKTGFCMGIYRPPKFKNLDTFFKEVSDCLSKASLTYENIIIMGDFNIDINTAGIKVDKLDEFCNLFDLKKLS